MSLFTYLRNMAAGAFTSFLLFGCASHGIVQKE